MLGALSGRQFGLRRPRRTGVDLVGELTREHGGAGSSAIDLLELGPPLGVGAEAPQEQAAVAADDGEHITEVVSRRELARRVTSIGIVGQGHSLPRMLPFESHRAGDRFPPPGALDLCLGPDGPFAAECSGEHGKADQEERSKLHVEDHPFSMERWRPRPGTCYR